MRTNLKLPPNRTHEGAVAGRQKPVDELRRTLMSCLLWEDTFYEAGNSIAERIAELIPQCDSIEVAALAIEARGPMKLRHAPLFVAREMARTFRGQSIVGDTIAAVVQRPDELSEFLSLYWKDGRQPLSSQVKRGLRKAFAKFNEHQLSKWNRDGAVKLRDVLFLVHAKPKDAEQAALWKRLVDNQLEVADTWEVALSKGADKRETWERLLREKQLGYMALLMNLRNMAAVDVDLALVEAALRDGALNSRALPGRFISAVKAAPQYAVALSDAMTIAASGDSISGSTALVIDVSGSMDVPVSAKSKLLRWEAAGALGVMLAARCESFRCFTFSDSLVEVMGVRGLGLIAAVDNSQPHGGTYLSGTLATLKQKVPSLRRVIVVTDEQSHDGIQTAWAQHSYLINVAPYQFGVDQSQGWKRVNGFSERVIDWIVAEEAATVESQAVTVEN